MAKKVVMICVMALLLPYIITLAWTGRIEEKKQVPLITSGKKVILDRKNGESYMDVEEYLPGVVAKQIPAEYGKEALRAQAVIARTFIYQKMNGQDEVKESELHMEYLEEKQMEAIRLQMLKNQINPHFLFNTLNAIAGMAQIEDAETTERMIEALSRLFRYNLKTTASVMPLEREIAVVKDYVYLQKMRFGERITCTFDHRRGAHLPAG